MILMMCLCAGVTFGLPADGRAAHGAGADQSH
jgi:hypothetical protein